MRLAIYHSLPSGGAKRALHETVRRLAAAQALDVYTLSSAEHVYGDVRPFARQHLVYDFTPLPLFRSPWGRLNQLQRWRDLYRLNAVERRIARDIDRAGYDVVYVQPSRWTQAPLVLHHLRTPSVYYVHEPLRLVYEPAIARPAQHARRLAWLDRLDPLIGLYRRRLRRLDQHGVRRATVRLANSHYTAAAVRRLYGCAAQVSYFGVDTQTFSPGPSLPEANLVLSVGAVRPSKGFDFIILALQRLPVAERPRLAIVANEADPEERAYLEGLAHAGQVDLTIEVGIDEARLVRHYRQAAVFVYAPVREPLGLAALEAMACGTPVVAVAEGGVRETVVDGQTGRLTARDLDEFAGALQALLARPDLRADLGRQARARVEAQWTWEAAVAQLVRHLEAARTAGPPAPPARSSS